MNLFEAKHILQSVGYTVNKDKYEQLDTILESMKRAASRGMLTEMSVRGNQRFEKVEGGKSKGDQNDIMWQAGAAEDEKSTIDSAISNFTTGKRTSAVDLSKYDKIMTFYDHYVKLANAGEELDPLVVKTYEDLTMDGYIKAILANDTSKIQKKNKGNGAGEGGNFGTALANGDIKRAIQVLQNRIRSGKAKGWGEAAKQGVISELQALLDSGKCGEYEATIQTWLETAEGIETGTTKKRSNDTYTALYDENVKLVLLAAVLRKYGITEPSFDEENMSVTFAAPPSVAARVSEALAEKWGMEVTKNERAVANNNTRETRTIIVDDAEVAEVALEDNDKITYEIGEDGEITICGTPKQIDKAIADIQDIGAEIIG